MKYILDTNLLQRGDIILTRKKSFQSKAIRIASNGKYSHALVCLSSTSLIEATVKGRVFTENPQRLIFKRKDDCKVLRINNILNQNDGDKLEYFLRSKIGTLYSIAEALKARSNQDKKTKHSGQFCSRLVAQAYDHIGIRLVHNADYCTPGNLDSSQLLITVQNAIRATTPEDIKIYKTPSQIKENQCQTYLWLDKTVKLAKKVNFNITSQSDVGYFLYKNSQFDNQVCEYIKSTNYLEQYKDDEKANPCRYNFNINFNEINYNNELYAINIRNFERHIRNYIACKQNFSITNLQYFNLLTNLYKNIIQQCDDRLNILKQYIQRDFQFSINKNPMNIHNLNQYLQEIYILQSKIQATI